MESYTVGRYLDKAKALAKNSNHHRYRLGCIIVRKGKIIGRGWNLQKTDPKAPHPFKHIHCEHMAVMSTGYKTDLSGCDVYVYRENIHGLKGVAKSCKYCHQMLVDRKVRNLYYTTQYSFGKIKVY